MYVYAIIFPNNKLYIGATSGSVEKRFREHITCSKRLDTKLYRALRKYGPENVEVRTIKQFNNKEEMFLAEKILINRHKTQINGYNSTSGGEGAIDLVYTEDMRQSISLAQKERFKNTEERIKSSLRIKKWIKNNKNEFLLSVERRNKTLKTKKHRSKMSKKMKILYKENPDLILSNTSKLIKKYKEDPSIAIRISRTLGGKSILVYRKGNFIKEYPTLLSCVRELNLNLGNVCSVLKGKRNHTKGYSFEYKI